jgi:hypothetical protein
MTKKFFRARMSLRAHYDDRAHFGVAQKIFVGDF